MRRLRRDQTVAELAAAAAVRDAYLRRRRVDELAEQAWRAMGRQV